MLAIEAKIDALMSILGNQDRRFHSSHEVGTVSNSALGLLYGHGILTIYENLLL